LSVGGHYTVSFAFSPDGGAPSNFSASFGGASLLSLTNPALSPFTVYSFDTTATAASQALTFSFRDDPGFLFLDAVSVSGANPARAPILPAPPPATAFDLPVRGATPVYLT